MFEGRRQGDCVSREIFERGSTALSELTWAAERYFPGDFDVVMSGGIFAAFPEYAQSVTAKASPRARMIRADVPPVFGCALEAVLRGGAVPGRSALVRGAGVPESPALPDGGGAPGRFALPDGGAAPGCFFRVVRERDSARLSAGGAFRRFPGYPVLYP